MPLEYSAVTTCSGATAPRQSTSIACHGGAHITGFGAQVWQVHVGDGNSRERSNAPRNCPVLHFPWWCGCRHWMMRCASGCRQQPSLSSWAQQLLARASSATPWPCRCGCGLGYWAGYCTSSWVLHGKQYAHAVAVVSLVGIFHGAIYAWNCQCHFPARD